MRHREKEEIDSRERRMQIARQAEFGEMILRPIPDTWSARMPAYCYTALCPDAELREPPKRQKGEEHGQEKSRRSYDKIENSNTYQKGRDKEQ